MCFCKFRLYATLGKTKTFSKLFCAVVFVGTSNRLNWFPNPFLNHCCFFEKTFAVFL